MQKIKSLFQRNYDGDRLVRDELVEGSEWVQRGEGVATVKWDGTSCMVKDGKLYKRYDAKQGKQPPAGAIPCEPEPDPNTGHWPHWVLVTDSNEDKWHMAAFKDCELPDGTYELVGERINGNRHKLSLHHLFRHGDTVLQDVPTDYEGLKAFMETFLGEGIVWHHPDGRMVKIKKRDFGYKW